MIYELGHWNTFGKWIPYTTADTLDWIKVHATAWYAEIPNRKLYARRHLHFGEGDYEIESWEVWDARETLGVALGNSPDRSLDKGAPLESA